jgi:polyisoprenoid-binding protein YceI
MTVAEKTTRIPGGVWVIDKLHSSASFAVRHATSTFRGGFRDFDARLETLDGEPKLTGTVKVESVDIDDENLRPHLLSPEFFDLERAPEVRFASTSIDAEGEELVVRGELEIRGDRREVIGRGHITEPIPYPTGGERISLELGAKIDRHDWGLDWNMELPGGGTILGDEVELTVNLELDKVEE